MKINIVINKVTREETAYDKNIYFTYEEKEYYAHLHWDKYEGFFLDVIDHNQKKFTPDPEWVSKWNDTHEEPLAYVLDSLTDKVLEGEGE